MNFQYCVPDVPIRPYKSSTHPHNKFKIYYIKAAQMVSSLQVFWHILYAFLIPVMHATNLTISSYS